MVPEIVVGFTAMATEFLTFMLRLTASDFQFQHVDHM
jgi:hypothetical protein